MKIINLIASKLGKFCKACGRLIENVGAGTDCNGYCERCYENGGDDE